MKLRLGRHSKHPKNGFFFIATVSAGVYSNGDQLAAFAPAFKGEGGNPENLSCFANSEEVGQVIET